MSFLALLLLLLSEPAQALRLGDSQIKANCTLDSYCGLKTFLAKKKYSVQPPEKLYGGYNGLAAEVCSPTFDRQVFSSADERLPDPEELLLRIHNSVKETDPLARYNLLFETYFHYLEPKLKIWEEIFGQVRLDILSFSKKKFPKLAGEIEERLVSAKVITRKEFYLGHQEMLFQNSLYTEPPGEIMVGGRILDAVQDPEAIYVMLAHESAHVLFGLLFDGVDVFGETLAHPPLQSMFLCQEKNAKSLADSPQDQESMAKELTADWFAHQIFAQHLKESKLSLPQKKSAVLHSMRNLCGRSEKKAGVYNRHPEGDFRIQQILFQPYLAELLGQKPLSRACGAK